MAQMGGSTDGHDREVQYKYWEAVGNWQSQATDWINDIRPNPEDISGGFSTTNFWLFAVKGDNSHYRYRLTYLTNTQLDSISTAIGHGGAKVIGISGNNFWLLYWK